MTDSSSFANSLTEPLRQPLWWAALASVSLHGMLGVGAPTISNLIYGGSNSKNRPGSVGLVELTPSEIGRLPQTIPARPFKNSPLSISPVPLPRTSLTPPLPPAPSTIDLPALPPGMPPPGFFSPGPLPAPNFNTPLPATPPPPAPKSPPKPPSVILQQPPNLIIPPFPPSNFDRNILPPPSVTPPFPPPANQGTLDEGEALEKLRNAQGRLPLFPDGAPVYTPEFPIGPRSSEFGAPKLTQKDPNKRGQTTETPLEVARRQEFQREQQKLQQGQSGSGATATRGEQIAAAGEKYIALFENFKRAYPNLEMTGPTPVNVPYPTAACSQKLEGVAVFGAVVNPQGALVALPPEGTIASTGSEILDAAARRVLIDPATTFSPASTHRLYQLAIEFKYDPKICGGAPPTRSPRPTQIQPINPLPSGPAPEAPTNQRPSPAPAPAKPNFEKETKPAPATQPAPQAKPSPVRPSPQPQPSPAQQPSPQPQPAPVETPAPEAAPSPAAAPAPAPETAPSPAAEPTPTPEAAPSPAAESTPAPEAAPSPAAESTPAPESAPSPSPEATPSPAG
ncbi:MAG: hypothetical protein ACRC62_36600 [Microcoleus sp.]